MLELVDSHCHLDSAEFSGDLPEVVARAKAAGVAAILNAGTRLDEVDAYLAVCSAYPMVRTTVGVHPEYAAEFPDTSAAEILSLTKHEKVVGIGECGLDYHYGDEGAPAAAQKKLFAEHIRAAQESRLSLVVHTRDADEDTIEILREHYARKPFCGVLHCFSSSKKLADFALEIGFYISASGIITFNKSQELQAIFAGVPAERLLIETDAPFLAPVPHRGKRNEPAFAAHTLDKLAALKGMEAAELAPVIRDNFRRLFDKFGGGEAWR